MPDWCAAPPTPDEPDLLICAYIRLTALVRDQIASGYLEPGMAVPSITTLS